jgi:hypothetical protein
MFGYVDVMRDTEFKQNVAEKICLKIEKERGDVIKMALTKTGSEDRR